MSRHIALRSRQMTTSVRMDAYSYLYKYNYSGEKKRQIAAKECCIQYDISMISLS